MNTLQTRRSFVKTSGCIAAGALAFPYINCGKLGVRSPMTRSFGRIPFEPTTLGLGGQASLQWTPDDVDPAAIIQKAFELGINYFDTSNLYGPSQMNFGKAFRARNLIPGMPGYASNRKKIFLTSKTHLRWAKGSREMEGLNNWTHGDKHHTLDDVRRSLSQIFGDGQGNYPKGAYLDMVLIHSVTSLADVDAVYTGLDKTDSKDEIIGALAALRDVRDGSNLTGLNPGEEKLIRHIGFSGHYSPAVMMEMIQRDEENLIDGMLVSINSNDPLYFNMQYNVIPVAEKKNMGLIAMKAFADGALYTKPARWSREPVDVVRSVGSADLPSRPLIEYSLTTPGIATAIIGIGHIDEDPAQCQLVQNMSAAQIKPEALSRSDRQAVETMTKEIKNGRTNYFQAAEQALTAVQDPAALMNRDGQVYLTWHNAYAGNAPVKSYRILRNGQEIASVPHVPQISKMPVGYEDQQGKPGDAYQIVAVDGKGRTSTSDVPSKT